MELKLTPWRRRLGYALFALAALAFSLRLTMPAEAVRERLVMEAAAQGWQLTVDEVAPAGLVGVRLEGVTLESRDGLRLPVERVDATLRLLPLLLGRRGLDLDARLFGGRAQGLVEERGTARRLVARLSGLELARAPLRRATGLDLAGTAHGDLDLTLDDRAPARSSGRLDLAVDGASVKGGELPVPGMAAGLTVPPIALGALTARAGVKEGRLTFDELEAKGADVEASGNGLYVQLGPRLALAPIFGKAKLKVSDAFWSRGANAGLKSLVDLALASARDRDGAFAFQVFGTLSRPQARPGS